MQEIIQDIRDAIERARADAVAQATSAIEAECKTLERELVDLVRLNCERKEVA